MSKDKQLEPLSTCDFESTLRPVWKVSIAAGVGIAVILLGKSVLKMKRK